MRLFHERGYENVGIAELAREIGVQPPSLYAAFGNKLGMLKRAVELYQIETTFIPEALNKEGPVGARLRNVLRAAARSYAKRGCPRGCLVMDCTQNAGDPEAAALTERLVALNRAAIAEAVAVEHPRAAETVADYVTTMLRGLSASARNGATARQLESVADLAADSVDARLAS